MPASDVPGRRGVAHAAVPVKPAPFAAGSASDPRTWWTSRRRSVACPRATAVPLGAAVFAAVAPRHDHVTRLDRRRGVGSGGVYDPETGTLYVKATNRPTLVRLHSPPAAAAVTSASWPICRSSSRSGAGCMRVVEAGDARQNTARQAALRHAHGDRPEQRRAPLAGDRRRRQRGPGQPGAARGAAPAAVGRRGRGRGHRDGGRSRLHRRRPHALRAGQDDRQTLWEARAGASVPSRGADDVPNARWKAVRGGGDRASGKQGGAGGLRAQRAAALSTSSTSDWDPPARVPPPAR